MVYPPYCCVLAEHSLPSQLRQPVHVLPAGDSAQMCKRLAQMGIEAERLIHPFIAGGAGDAPAEEFIRGCGAANLEDAYIRRLHPHA